MLIIAQPKSASTSLMLTLGKLTGRRATQLARKGLRQRGIGRMRRGNNPYYRLPHHDMIEYSEEVLCGLANDEKQIFKQHIAPTKNNVKIIIDNKLPCVILLREPKACAEAYSRHMSLQNRGVKTMRGGAENESKTAESLWLYRRGWQKLNRLSHIEVVHFEHLVMNPTKVVNGILEFWGYKKVPRVHLEKARFTGRGILKLMNRTIKPKPIKRVGKEYFKEHIRGPKEWDGLWDNPWHSPKDYEVIPYHFCRKIVTERKTEKMLEAYVDEWWGTPTICRPWHLWQFLKQRRFKTEVKNFRKKIADGLVEEKELDEWFEASGLEFPADPLRPVSGCAGIIDTLGVIEI